MASAAVVAEVSFSWGWRGESAQAPRGALASRILPSFLPCCITGIICIPRAQLETSCSTALENQAASSCSKAEIQELEVTRKGRLSPPNSQ